jgi:predicted lipoprotein with Yx(FWY)xxD motif
MRRVLFALIVALIVPSSAMASSVQVRSSAYGPVLFSGSGRALYLFTSDRTRRSTCHGGCARAWPPFYAKGRATVRGGARRGLLGTTRRRNGRRQVTYAGHPLYFYVGDPVGQIRCQNVFEFGGTWLVVSPNGRAVR